MALLSVAAAAAGAQTATSTPPITSLFNRNIIYIDPAHGGADGGAHITGQLLEKDVTLALAQRLKESLGAKGFTVVLARPGDDPGTQAVTLDDRAGIANHVRPVACILLHATPAGKGTQLYVSSLNPPAEEPRSLNWNSAQGPWVPQSLRLASELGGALTRAHVPTLIHSADPKPLDSLICPAVALEVSPLPSGSTTTPVGDAAYQQHIAEALTNALVFWKGHADPRPDPNASPANPSMPGARPSTPSAKPAPAVETPAPPKPTPAAKPAAPAPAKPASIPDAAPKPARLLRPASASRARTEATL